MLTKDPGKLLALSAILHVLKEANEAVKNKVPMGFRIDNECEQWTVEMAVKILRLCNLQRLIVFEEYELLHVLEPDTFPDPVGQADRRDDENEADAAAIQKMPRKLVSTLGKVFEVVEVACRY